MKISIKKYIPLFCIGIIPVCIFAMEQSSSEKYSQFPIELVGEIIKQDIYPCANVQDVLNTVEQLSKRVQTHRYLRKNRKSILQNLRMRCSESLLEQALEKALVSFRWRAARALVELGVDIVKILTVPKYEESQDVTFSLLGKVLFSDIFDWSDAKRLIWFDHILDLLNLQEGVSVEDIFRPAIKPYQPLLMSLIYYHKYAYVDRLLEFVKHNPSLTQVLLRSIMGQRENITAVLLLAEFAKPAIAYEYIKKILDIAASDSLLVRFLLETQDNKTGAIPLMAAVKQKNVPLIKLLLQRGTYVGSNQINIRNTLRKRAQDYAQESGSVEIKRLFTE